MLGSSPAMDVIVIMNIASHKLSICHPVDSVSLFDVEFCYIFLT